MHKPLIALASAASVGLVALVAPVDANAGCYGCAVGLGILGGVAAGAIVGSAIANSPRLHRRAIIRPRPPDILRLHPERLTHRRRLMLNWHQVVTGDTSEYGSRAMAISGELYKCAVDQSATRLYPR